MKVKQHFPEVGLVLRIRADDVAARCNLGDKYGAEEDEWQPLLAAAKAHGLAVVGISFHVGSGATNPAAFPIAVAKAREAFDMALSMGFAMRLLDLGGGYSGNLTGGVTMAAVSASLSAALEQHFPADQARGLRRTAGGQRADCGGQRAKAWPPSGRAGRSPWGRARRAPPRARPAAAPAWQGVMVIAEPGRYFAEPGMTLFTRIFGKRVRQVRPPVRPPPPPHLRAQGTCPRSSARGAARRRTRRGWTRTTTGSATVRTAP